MKHGEPEESPSASLTDRRGSIRCDAYRKLFVMLWAAVAKFCSISRTKVSAAFSRASCLRLGRIGGRKAIMKPDQSARDVALAFRNKTQRLKHRATIAVGVGFEHHGFKPSALGGREDPVVHTLRNLI